MYSRAMVLERLLISCKLDFLRINLHLFFCQETDDLVLVDIDEGTVTSSCAADLPDVPVVGAECFKRR